MLSFRSFIQALRSARGALLLALVLFGGGIALGWAGTSQFEALLQSQLEGLSDVATQLNEADNPQLSFFLFIFFNNALKGAAIIFLGALLGVLPALFALINGAVIGYLVHLAALQGLDLYELIVKGLLPHGIIEIPALLIACAFGLQFGGKAIASLFGKRNTDWNAFMRRTVTVAFWVVLLMLIAAIIESTLTMALLA